MSTLDHVDRRRLVVATAITVIALPSLWLSSRADDSAAPHVATAGVVVSADSGSEGGHDGTGHGGPGDAPRAADALGTPGGAFLELPEQPVGDHSATAESDRTIRVATAASPNRKITTGRATFRSSLPSADVCAVAGAPYGVRVRVTNLDNGHSLTCVASVSAIDLTADAVLHTSAFSTLALLADAPVPVEISW